MKYIKKPIVIEAMKYIGSKSRIERFVGMENLIWEIDYVNANELLYIKTPEGNMLVSEGDYVIKGLHGEFWPINKAIFEEIYTEAIE